jgi:hypothetical protein
VRGIQTQTFTNKNVTSTWAFLRAIVFGHDKHHQYNVRQLSVSEEHQRLLKKEIHKRIEHRITKKAHQRMPRLACWTMLKSFGPELLEPKES